MPMTIRPVRTREFIGLSETNTIGYGKSQKFPLHCQTPLNVGLTACAGPCYNVRHRSKPSLRPWMVERGQNAG